MSPPLEIRVLGPLSVAVAGETRELPKSRKTRALLTMLALEPEPHGRAALCDWIWPDTADPRASLRWSLTKLRDVLKVNGDAAIASSRESVGLKWDQVSTDQQQLVDLLERSDAVQLQTLVDFERRFDRTPLVGLDSGTTAEFQLWLESQRESLTRLHHRLLTILIERLAEEPGEAQGYARRQVSLDPLNPSANVRLLSLTAKVGGRQEAQSVLEKMRARFSEAGLPDHELLTAWRSISGTRSDRTIELAAVATEARTLPQKPSVAVLTFENLGQHKDGDVLAEGITVDLNSRLAQLKGLFVIARGSSARFNLANHPTHSVGDQLGVRYLVHGTTQRTNGRLRVTVNLIEAEQGSELWSDHFDRPLGDLFEVQDDMANHIVSALEPQIDHAEMDRVRLLPTENLDAWECFHRAMWHSFRFTTEDNRSAHELFRQALTQDPQFSRAYAGLSFNHFSRAFLNASDDVEGEIARALEFAEQAVGFDGRDAMGHWALGRAQLLNREHDRAISAIDRALIANPNYAQGHYARGFVGLHRGVQDHILPDLDMARRLSPFDPMLFAMKSSRGIALALQGRFEEATEWALGGTQEPNAHFHIHAVAAACLELSNRSEEALRHGREVKKRHPGYSAVLFQSSFPLRQPKHAELFAGALRRAGLD